MTWDAVKVILIDNLPFLWDGIKLTIFVTFVTLFFGFILGLVLAWLRSFRFKPIKWMALSIINLVRGIPVLIQLFFIYFGLNSFSFIKMEPLTAGMIGITVNAAVYFAEIIRSGIESIDKGQTEAARTLGLSKIKAMRYIILPQAFRRMIPAFMNQVTITLKDTSLLYTIGIAELAQQGFIIVGRTFASFEVWTIIGLVYFVMVYSLTQISNLMERKLKLR
ncbi:amino acid ABC transporter permease [Jeotgalibacillus marinus]|uniref:Amino acid ABC transporter permease n=1 Tax=Jeotgalibacillus marinus TaxID=86667 RepID=A0ABV3Q6B3_9BACL